MDRKAIEKAHSRLRVARQAIGELAACRSFDDFNDCWYMFLTASKNTYTVLEQGAKVNPQSRQWFGGKKEERKRDELLQYVFQARNDDEHRIEPIAEHVPEQIIIGITKEGFSSNMTMNRSGNQIHIHSNDSKPVLIEQSPAHVKLVAVRGRGGELYCPPKTHKGKPLESDSPLHVALLFYAHVEALIKEAEALA